ncbi:hypothetical protein GCM10009578_038080 [Streptomyces rhizosphaericus]
MPVPPGSGYGLHALVADDVWAAGATDLCAAVSHWDRQAWQQTIVDGFPRSAVGSVLAVSPTEVWVAGTAGFVSGPALAEYLVRAGHAACLYAWRMPPRRSWRRMSRWLSLSGSSIGVGSGVAVGRSRCPDPRVIADIIEQSGELPIPVPDHEPGPAAYVLEIHDQVLRRLCHPGCGRVCGGAQEPDAAAAVLDHHEYVHPRAGQGDRLKEVTGQEGVGWGAQDVPGP